MIYLTIHKYYQLPAGKVSLLLLVVVRAGIINIIIIIYIFHTRFFILALQKQGYTYFKNTYYI